MWMLEALDELPSKDTLSRLHGYVDLLRRFRLSCYSLETVSRAEIADLVDLGIQRRFICDVRNNEGRILFPFLNVAAVRLWLLVTRPKAGEVPPNLLKDRGKLRLPIANVW